MTRERKDWRNILGKIAEVAHSREKGDMKRSSWKRLLQVALLSILIAILFSATVSASNNLTVHFLDVGQGDSELIQQ
jgi:beta-lactamase superfamily II metal-dependent hydrolase